MWSIYHLPLFYWLQFSTESAITSYRFTDSLLTPAIVLGEFDPHTANHPVVLPPSSLSFSVPFTTHLHFALGIFIWSIYISQNCPIFRCQTHWTTSSHISSSFTPPHLFCPLISPIGSNSSVYSYLFSLFSLSNLSIVLNSISPNPLTSILSINSSYVPSKTSSLDQFGCLFIPPLCLDW